jgi:hypothetical protein
MWANIYVRTSTQEAFLQIEDETWIGQAILAENTDIGIVEEMSWSGEGLHSEVIWEALQHAIGYSLADFLHNFYNTITFVGNAWRRADGQTYSAVDGSRVEVSGELFTFDYKPDADLYLFRLENGFKLTAVDRFGEIITSVSSGDGVITGYENLFYPSSFQEDNGRLTLLQRPPNRLAEYYLTGFVGRTIDECRVQDQIIYFVRGNQTPYRTVSKTRVHLRRDRRSSRRSTVLRSLSKRRSTSSGFSRSREQPGLSFRK